MINYNDKLQSASFSQNLLYSPTLLPPLPPLPMTRGGLFLLLVLSERKVFTDMQKLNLISIEYVTNRRTHTHFLSSIHPIAPQAKVLVDTKDNNKLILF